MYYDGELDRDFKFKSIAACRWDTQCQPRRRDRWEDGRFTEALAIGQVDPPVGDPVGRSNGRMGNLPIDVPSASECPLDGMSLTSRRDYHPIGMSKTPVERPDLPMGGCHFT